MYVHGACRSDRTSPTHVFKDYVEQNRTSFPSLLRGDVSGSELPSSGELGGSPSAAAGGKRGREAREREAS